MINKIRDWHKRNKDLVNTFILIVIALYSYFEIKTYEKTYKNICDATVKNLSLEYELLYNRCNLSSEHHFFGVPDTYNNDLIINSTNINIGG